MIVQFYMIISKDIHILVSNAVYFLTKMADLIFKIIKMADIDTAISEACAYNNELSGFKGLIYSFFVKLLTAVTSRFATLTTAITQNQVTIVRPCDRSNLNTSDSGAELASSSECKMLTSDSYRDPSAK